uniref:Uncharacterized protein n=1 Tax=Panagrolaimus sp. ES5 TaxID=591445 RepID=A0AC34F5Y9_9BILA
MNCHMKFKIIWACLGISAGILAGGTFAAEYKNYVAASIAFFSSICAGYLLYIHISYHKRHFHSWPQQNITAIIIINWILAALGLIGMVISLVIAGLKHQTLTHDGLMNTNCSNEYPSSSNESITKSYGSVEGNIKNNNKLSPTQIV